MVSQPCLLTAIYSCPGLVLRACFGCVQAGSKRVLNAKSDKFQGNIHKRGKVQDVSPVSPILSALRERLSAQLCTATIEVCGGVQKSSSKVAVGPIMLGFFLFVVVGSGKQSCLLYKSAQSSCHLLICTCCCSIATNYQNSNKWRYDVSYYPNDGQ